MAYAGETPTTTTIGYVPPYVVSADVAGLMEAWAAETGYTLPPSEVFDDLSTGLRNKLREVLGSRVEIVSEHEMRQGMSDLMTLADTGAELVSLDRAYVAEDDPRVTGFIDATRAVREVNRGDGSQDFESAGDLKERPGALPLEEQIEALRTDKPSPIILIDDVIFNGDGVIKLSERLAMVNRPVVGVIAGIGIRDGINKIEAAGIKVDCVRTYAEVFDEVCERDFFPGVPMSGRTVVGPNGEHWSAPYVNPYGKPETWASIDPERCADLSQFCLEQAVRLWDAVGQASGRPVPADQVPRPLKNAGSEPITERLRQDLGNL